MKFFKHLTRLDILITRLKASSEDGKSRGASSAFEREKKSKSV